MKHFGEKFPLYILAYLALEACFCNPLKCANTSNQLKWVDLMQNQSSTQIIFDFTKPISFKREVIKEKNQLQLSFPGMNLQTFNPQEVVFKLTTLKKSGLIKHIKVEEKTDGISRVVLILEFAPYRSVKTSASNASPRIKNQILIKWCTLKNPNSLILEIFRKEDLEKIIKKDAIFLRAKNDIFSSDSSPPSHLRSKRTSKNFRIIIDPGHGGSDSGAQYKRLIEKKLALDIGKRVYRTLKKKAYKVLLTRSIDKNVSLAHRAHLAQQLKADLFVSIHINAAEIKRASGVETFYFDGHNMLSSGQQTGFLFVNFKKDLAIVRLLENRLKTRLNKSKLLATHIQNNLVSFLRKNRFNVVNRKTKPNRFQVFIRSGVPSSLVEVGFLTNQKEARLLAQPKYREFIAQGICNGIFSYLNSQYF